MKPHKVENRDEGDRKISTGSENDEESHGDSVENKSKKRKQRSKKSSGHNTRESGHVWHHYRRWRLCKVLLMDQYFAWEFRKVLNLNLLTIKNLHSQLTFAPANFGTIHDWAGALNAAQLTSEARAYTIANPHDSFAPIRTDSQIIVGIDGASYMSAVADAIEAARHEILITDWFLSPEIYLKRPYSNNRWRLDELLRRKAEQGVRICIMIYREVKFVMGINSRYTMKKLTSMHKNIHVIRHPSHLRDHTWNWSHHEKMVVVDQSVVFMGGIDLCFGRWDLPDHPLLDVAVKSSSLEVTDLAYLSLSTAFLPIRILTSTPLADEITNLTDPNRCIRTDCRTPCIRANSTSAAFRTHREMINRHSMTTEVDESVVFSEDDEVQSDRRSRRAKRLWSDVPHLRKADSGLNFNDLLASHDQGQFLFPGKDYANMIYKNLAEVDKPEESYIDRSMVPRMPWHDVGVGLTGKIVSDFVRHFIQRWNAHRKRKAKHARKRLSVSHVPPVLIPMQPANPDLAARLHQLGGGGSCELSANLPQPSLRTQALRSVSHWSLVSVRDAKANTLTVSEDSNYANTEHSIENAYVEVIKSAEHFIYIENQFFISFMEDSDPRARVRNKISQAIYDRVVRAYREKKPFRVYILIPLLPNFEGIPGDKKTGASIHTILYYTRLSLFRGNTALLPRLRLEVGDVDNYVSVCGLRNYECWNDGCFTTELIYIHDKIMIVDDRKLIIGSANINDRSLLGDRDSEIGLYVEETPSAPGEGVVSNMRLRLMAEHLGVFRTDRSDPLFWHPDLLLEPASDAFFHGVWRKTAHKNMVIFDKVFKCPPSNEIQKYPKDPAPLQGRRPRGAKVEKILRKVRGHLCEYPQDYLADEKLVPPPFKKERLANEDIWI
ncbi:hypothetical protein Aperf_G00000096516 [Anoplocephala perfoliata]